MPNGVTIIIGAKQTPGLIVESEPAVVAVPFPFDPSVTHCNVHPPTPLHLPVTAAAQNIFTEQLKQIKSVVVVGIRLQHIHTGHPVAVVGQLDLPAHCVCVNGESAGI